MGKLVRPAGQTEAEEAQWWFDHREELTDEFLASPEALHPQRGTAARRFGLSQRILLAPEAAALAKKQAASEGIPYEKYASQVLYEALQARELRRVS